MKDKASVTFRRNANGEVVGEIINEEGVIVQSRRKLWHNDCNGLNLLINLLDKKV